MDPFRTHLVTLLSIYELGPLPGTPIPQYEGPTDWQTETILKSLTSVVRRMYTAEETKCEEVTSYRGAPEKVASSKGDLSIPRVNEANMSISLDACQARADVVGSPSSVSSDPGHSSNSPTSHARCPTCGKSSTDSLTLPRYSDIIPGSIQIPPVAPVGPLTATALKSGVSTIGELDLLKAQVQDVIRVCNAVARGDLSQKLTVLTVRDLTQQIEISVEGEMSTLKGAVNSMVDQLSAFASEVTRVALEVGTQGILGGQARVEGVQGTWADLTRNVNKMASNLTDQVRSISEVTKAVALGDLGKLVNVDVQGEMLDLKMTVNSMVVQLSTLANEVTRVSLEVGTEGILGGQAFVPYVQGMWKVLTDNVNLMAMSLTNQVRSIAEVTKAVGGGDLTKKIKVDVHGEILELKETVNGMVDRLGQSRRRPMIHGSRYSHYYR